jgi:hypothetical protein
MVTISGSFVGLGNESETELEEILAAATSRSNTSELFSTEV